MLAALGLVVSPAAAGCPAERVPDRRRADARGALADEVAELGEQARLALGDPDAELRVIYELRYRGQAFELPIAGSSAPDPGELREAFEAEHEDRYGYSDPEQELELVTIRVTATVPGVDVELAAGERRAARSRASAGARCSAASEVELEAIRGALPPGTADLGPVGRRAARVDAARPAGMGRRGRADRHDPAERATPMIDPVELQVLTGALRAICEEMGAVLIQSAHSANIKERRDASTALFDPRGEMVMQAEHIPVHLGAMPAAVAAVLDEDQRPAARGSSTTRTEAGPTCRTSP